MNSPSRRLGTTAWALLLAITCVASCTDPVQALGPVEPEPQEDGNNVPLSLVRFTSGSGNILVSNAIPLAPGKLRDTDLGKVRITVGGREVSMHVAALAGRHPDGSLRAILVQFRHELAYGTDVAATLRFGTARTTQDIAAPDHDRSTVGAVALPSSASYLVATDIVGETIARAEALTDGPTFQRYESDFDRFADYHYGTQQDLSWGSNYYDRALIYYAFWARTANPEFWRRATITALNYRRDYLEANNYGSSPHWSQLEGLEKHYLLTGDEKSRTAVARVAQILGSGSVPDTVNVGWLTDNPDVEARILARELQAMFLAHRLEAPIGSLSGTWATRLDRRLAATLATQSPDGAYRYRLTCYNSLNYMAGLLNDVYIKIYTYHRRDPRLVEAVRKNVDFLWNTQWLPAEGSFQYYDVPCPNSGGTEPSPDLNNLYTTSFGWLYRQTGDERYRQRGDSVFIAGVEKTFLHGFKQFNQEYTSSYRYLAYRRPAAR